MQWMSFSRPIQWYHSQAGPISPDGTLNLKSCHLRLTLGPAPYAHTYKK
jgi:hypothetical protein